MEDFSPAPVYSTARRLAAWQFAMKNSGREHGEHLNPRPRPERQLLADEVRAALDQLGGHKGDTEPD